MKEETGDVEKNGAREGKVIESEGKGEKGMGSEMRRKMVRGWEWRI